MTHVLITGGGGYIGSQLIESLLAHGFRVTCVDRFFFGRSVIAPFVSNPNFRDIRRDIRDVTVTDFKNVDAVIDLAGISNDPSCDLDPSLTELINFQGTVHVAKTAKEAGVRRYVMASSCSIYGAGSDKILDEDSELRPVSLYARSKIKAEQNVQLLASPEFSVTFLRLATVFGVSRRMRFDLIVNIMTMHAFQSNRIIVMGGGRQWRPLIHVSDVALAFLTALKSPLEQVNGEAFNVGSNEQNFQVIQVANMIKNHLKNVEIMIAPDDIDKRSYRVNFDKIRNQLGFQPKVSVREGIEEIYAALQAGTVDAGDIRAVTVKYYRYLIDTDRLLNEIKIEGRLF